MIAIAISTYRKQRRRQSQRFEIVLIKGNSTARPRVADEPGGRFVATGVPLTVLIGFAYPGTLVDSPAKPSWTDTDLWDIEAKASEGAVLPRTKLPDFNKPDTINLMVQSLFEDRFQMKVHRETREVPIYEVTVAKGGLKMRLGPNADCASRRAAAPGTAPRGGMRMARGDFQGSAVSMENIVLTIGQLTGRRAIDKTEVTGL